MFLHLVHDSIYNWYIVHLDWTCTRIIVFLFFVNGMVCLYRLASAVIFGLHFELINQILTGNWSFDFAAENQSPPDKRACTTACKD